MRRYKKHLLFLLTPVAFFISVDAQEILVPPTGNPHLAGQASLPPALFKSATADTLDLPFLDEFSTSGPMPDPALWSDNSAYVNRSFPLDPPSLGAATLDALDATGSVYPTVRTGSRSQAADTLSSWPIRMNSVAGDSVYLSFFYQPGGLGDLPEEEDSLLLDFFCPGDTSWVNVWGIPGTGFHSFQQVMVPITDPACLVDGFRFRFRNLISLPDNNHYPDKMSNVDLWNIDYVRLGRMRSASDTVLRDVAIVEPMEPALRDLSAMPWSHFRYAAHLILDTVIQVRYRNNDTIVRNVGRSLVIEQPMWDEVYEPQPPTAQDLAPGEDTVVNYRFFMPPDIDYDRGDSALFRFKAALRTDEVDPKMNDTVYNDLLFNDFYSYDDGSNEAGFGLRGGGSANGMVALKYESYTADRIGGVDICFNRLKDSVNLGYYFNLMVWADNGGVPGSPLLEDGDDRLPFYASRYPGFVRYYFTEAVEVDGTFYVGWKQFKEYNINFGLDLNSIPVNKVLYYNLGTEWIASEAPGSLMIRPFLYDETVATGPARQAPGTFRLYPNPAASWVNIELEAEAPTGAIRWEIYDLSGRLLQTDLLRDRQIDVAFLQEGMYYLSLKGAGEPRTAKLLIRR